MNTKLDPVLNTLKAQWRDWNTDRNISSGKRNEKKIASLLGLVRSLTRDNQDLTAMVEGVTHDFYKKGFHLQNNGVENLLNDYVKYAPELSLPLSQLAAEVDNTWRSS
jgi:hypothetical protein